MPDYTCEVCEKTETLTEEEAYNAGWDYPPFMGVWGIVSPRTCGDCLMVDTAWWAIMQGKAVNDLSEKHKATVMRILAEVDLPPITLKLEAL